MATYRVYGLDVWGHGPDEHEQYDCDGNCDGYQVNDRSQRGTVDISEDATDQQILEALVESDFLMGFCATQKHCTIESSDEDFIEVNRTSDGRYLLQLEREQE
jgi:hypothetical protein